MLVRSTRGLTLTAAGERYLPRFVRFVAELEEMFAPAVNEDEPITGHLRIKAPTTVSSGSRASSAMMPERAIGSSSTTSTRIESLIPGPAG